jgi:hypothetical protein
MKKHVFQATMFALLFTVCFLSSCQKEGSGAKQREVSNRTSNSLQPNANDSNVVFGSREAGECDFFLSPSDIRTIGTEHNRLVRDVFDRYRTQNGLTIFQALNASF